MGHGLTSQVASKSEVTSPLPTCTIRAIHATTRTHRLINDGYLRLMPSWRNWQTRWTQNTFAHLLLIHTGSYRREITSSLSD